MTELEKITRYIRDKSINLAALSRSTGIPYKALYNSFGKGGSGKMLRADEYLKLKKELEQEVRF